MTTSSSFDVPKFGLVEISLRGSSMPANPFADARAAAEFVSPSGRTIRVEGFYYGGDEWRVRFVPREHGQWRYTASLTGAGKAVQDRGQFVCRGTQGHGFLRPSGPQKNCFRLEYEDGTPFYPIGIQTCDFLQPDFDGPMTDGKYRKVSPDEWAKAFDGAVNLVRTQMGQGTRDGCALPLIAAPPKRSKTAPASEPSLQKTPFVWQADRYDTGLSARMDQAFVTYRGHGMAQILILFQDMSLWGDGHAAFGNSRDLSSPKSFKSIHAANMPLQEQYIRYVVARFGAFVDVWELYNEDSYAPDDYLAHLAKVVRQADPYGHIITTNYPRPTESWNEVIAWHEYMSMPASEVDAYLVTQFAMWKSYGKVVLNTEFGNSGALSNCDPVKWRIATWAAFMNETSLLFWSDSGRVLKPHEATWGNSNAYIGPETRLAFRTLMAFSKDMPVDMKPVACGFHNQLNIRSYALSNGKVTALYVHHFADHQKEYRHEGTLMVWTGPGKFRLRWIDPASGAELSTQELETRQHYLLVPLPPVTVDIACRIDRM